jgi:hypothetical protein
MFPLAAWWCVSAAVLAAGVWCLQRGFFRSGFMMTQGENGDERFTRLSNATGEMRSSSPAR